MKTKLVIGLLACGLMFNIACEPGAQQDDPVDRAQERTEETGYIDDQTSEVLTETASLNMMNMELSRIAEERAVTPEVKQLAQEIAESHREINQELEALAQKEPIVLPEQMSSEHQDKINDVVDNQGIDFDKEYVNEIKNIHQDKIDEYENLARETDNPEIREFALSTLPKLRMHHEKAERLEEQLDETSQDGVFDGGGTDDNRDTPEREDGRDI